MITLKSIHNPALMDDQILSGAFEEVTPYFMNRDGCMETTATAAPDAALAAGAGTGMPSRSPGVPPPPLSVGGSSNPNGNDGCSDSRSD